MVSFVWVLNEKRIPQVDVFFLPDPKDRLRLSFPMLIRPCYSIANIFTLLRFVLQILYPDDKLSYAHVCSKMF